MSQDGQERRTDGEGGIGPYLVVVAVALVLGIGLAVYLMSYRAEILSILLQSPT